MPKAMGKRDKGYRRSREYPTGRPGGRGPGGRGKGPPQPTATGAPVAAPVLAAPVLAAPPPVEGAADDDDGPLLDMNMDESASTTGLFTLFADKIAAELQGSGTGSFVESIMIMLPQSTASGVGGAGEIPHLLTDIMGYCRSPTLNEPMATQDDRDETDKEYSRRKKQAIGELFSHGVNLPNMGQFYTTNSVHMQSLISAEKQYSERLARASNVKAQELLVTAGVSEETKEGPIADLSDFRDIEMPGGKIIPGVRVDGEGLRYIKKYTRYIKQSAIEGSLETILTAAEIATTVSIKIGLTVIRMSVYGLISLSKYLYDKSMEKLGGFGDTVNYIMNKLWVYKKLLFGGPFMDITNPSADSSYNRRMNRFVYLFLYAMIYLLKFIKENMRIIPATIPCQGECIQFLEKQISEWSFDEIFEHGPELFVYIMKNRDSYKDPGALDPGVLQGFYENYDNSIKVVTESLDARITQHLVNDKMVPTGETNQMVIDSTPPIREADTQQMEKMREAIFSSLNIGLSPELDATIRIKGYGGMMDAMVEEIGHWGAVSAPALEPEPQGDAAAALSKKKKTRRRRKSKSRNSKKSKKKKGKKRKQTRRGRKKK